MREQSRRSYEFGPFCADPIKRVLLRDCEPVPLAPKVLEMLVALIESRDRVLTKDELLKQVPGFALSAAATLTHTSINTERLRSGQLPRP